MIGECPRCGVGIDRDRQCTTLGGRLYIADTVTDPATGEEWEVIYCWTCAVALWPELADLGLPS
jgi:hypothetical protein